MKKARVTPRLPLDKKLLFLILFLLAFGSVMVFSASYAYADIRFHDKFYFVRRQVLWAGVGLLLLWGASSLPLAKIYRYTPHFYIAVTVLLALVPFLGTEAGGAKRWISLGPFSFQPSELAKTALVFILAYYFTRVQERILHPKTRKDKLLYGIVFPFLLIGSTCFLVVLEKHLSCTVILLSLGLLMMFLAGSDAKILGGLCLFGGLGVTAFALSVEYTRRRITIWLNPELYPRDGGWQTLQGLMAIGSGGLFGLGLGNSRLKYMYVSEPQNDFIFTVACEELGFLGAFSILLLFALFIYRSLQISLSHPDTFSRLVGIGITGKVAVQVLLNIAVVTNVLPNTGISLPFFSYGGSSLSVLLGEMGILLALSRDSGCQH